MGSNCSKVEPDALHASDVKPMCQRDSRAVQLLRLWQKEFGFEGKLDVFLPSFFWCQTGKSERKRQTHSAEVAFLGPHSTCNHCKWLWTDGRCLWMIFFCVNWPECYLNLLLSPVIIAQMHFHTLHGKQRGADKSNVESEKVKTVYIFSLKVQKSHPIHFQTNLMKRQLVHFVICGSLPLSLLFLQNTNIFKYGLVFKKVPSL